MGRSKGFFVPCEVCAKPCFRRPSELSASARAFCSRGHYNTRQLEPVSDRFWKFVTRTDTCWLWTGGCNSAGYGMFQAGASNSRLAHRTAYEFAAGTPLPEGSKVIHTCDTPLCVRNDDPGVYFVNGELIPRFGHLALGTQAANIADMTAKNRRAIGADVLAHNPARGIALPQARVSEDAVRLIRAAYSEGIPQTVLAAEYGISQMTVSKIVRRETWAHVD